MLSSALVLNLCKHRAERDKFLVSNTFAASAVLCVVVMDSLTLRFQNLILNFEFVTTERHTRQRSSPSITKRHAQKLLIDDPPTTTPHLHRSAEGTISSESSLNESV